MNTRIASMVSVTALILGSGAALADTSAKAMTDLNLRTGPGPMFKIVDVIKADESVMVTGCVETADWCKVVLEGREGWSYAPYLVLEVSESALDEAVEAESVAVVEFSDKSDEAALVSGGLGAVAGALVAGPAGAVAGGVLGGIAGDLAVKPEVKVYATEHPVEPVILNGEAVVGAKVPSDVTVYEMPEFAEYAYLNVNGDTVIIDSDTRKIVDILR